MSLFTIRNLGSLVLVVVVDLVVPAAEQSATESRPWKENGHKSECRTQGPLHKDFPMNGRLTRGSAEHHQSANNSIERSF